MKSIPDEEPADSCEAVADSIRREVDVLASLAGHNNIVELIGFSHIGPGKHACLVLECAPVGDLHDALHLSFLDHLG